VSLSKKQDNMKNQKHGNEFANDKVKDIRVTRLLFFALGLITGFLLTALIFCEKPI
jgi:hypothetical protein